MPGRNIFLAPKTKCLGVLTATVAWINDKGSKFDLHLTIHNENPDKGIIVCKSDMACRRGNVTEILNHTFFNTGERTIDFKPNETKSFTMVCRTAGKPIGDFNITIGKVYENPSLDGKTAGHVAAKDLTWNQSDRRE